MDTNQINSSSSSRDSLELHEKDGTAKDDERKERWQIIKNGEGNLGRLASDGSPHTCETNSIVSMTIPSDGRTTRQMLLSANSEFCSFDPNASYSIEDELIYTTRARLEAKDFSSEVRASMDIEQFVHQAELLLDPNVVSVDEIVDSMLEMIVASENLNQRRGAQLYLEARESLFLPGSTLSMARVIQGASSLTKHSGDQHFASLDFDQSWLCVLCDLASIRRRHMVLTRFKRPMNMGENAQEVRLFVLIAAPSDTKGTKNAYETGRTFSTMLADLDLRRKLLQAASETELRAWMILKAQEMSQSDGPMKMRHKYLLDATVHRAVAALGKRTTELGDNLASAANGDDAAGVFTMSLMDKANSGKQQLSSTISMSNTKCGGGGPGGPGDLEDSTNPNMRQRLAGLFCRHPDASKLIELIYPSADKSLVGGGGQPDIKMANYLAEQRHQQQAEASESGRKTGSQAAAAGCCACAAMLCKQLEFGKGLWDDFCRRARVYPSDFKDAFVGPPKTIQKTVATTWFLYFGILLPIIAFSALNTNQTNGHMGDLRKAIIGQAIGGLGFALLGGQPLVIIMTTAPLCLYTKVIYNMCIDYGFHFPAMYAAVGLWNGFFLVIYSLFGFSRLMKWCTRSTEEVFAMFIVVAFITDACKDMAKNFSRYYYAPACKAMDMAANKTGAALISLSGINSTTMPPTVGQLVADDDGGSVCRRETSLLFVLLMLGTLWLAITLYRFNKTPYLATSKRELLADYALPIAVIAMSFFGSYVFEDVYVEKFPPLKEISFERAQVELLPLSGILTAMGLGFTLSLLFFMDQNISAAMVNAPQNKLKKGCGYHFDLLVVAVLNGFLTMYGLPMMHGVLPHSPLHVRSLADIEQRVEQGHVHEVITNVRETRVTGIVSHILILLSLSLIPYPIAYIPTAVLNGLFLYMAVTSLDGLQIFERIMLLFTEQNKYPPNHYIRRCPQSKIHQFTFLQLVQLLILCLLGFSPINVIEMFFPVVILLMIPFRLKVVPKCVDEKYLEALDGKH